MNFFFSLAFVKMDVKKLGGSTPAQLITWSVPLFTVFKAVYML